MSRRFLTLGGTVLAATLGAAVWWNQASMLNTDDLLAQANAAFEHGDLQTAARQASQLLLSRPDNAAAMLIIGRCQEARGFPEAAARTFEAVPSGQPPFSSEAAWRCGHIQLLTLGQPRAAEHSYLRALRDDPDSLMANEGLTILWGFSGQWWRQIRPRLAMLRAGKTHRVHLLSMALGEDSLDVSLDIAQMRNSAPDDPLVLLAMARLAIEKEEYPSAINLLTAAVRDSPSLVQAHIRLGEIYFEQGNEQRFAAWSRNLPVEAREHPTTWVLRGKWALRHSTPETALRCFCEAIQRDANQPDALYQAGQILTGMQRADDAARFLKRARDLQEFLNAAKAADTDDNLRGSRRVAMLAESLGNTWEAFAWASLTSSHPTKPLWAQQMADRLRARLTELPFTRTEAKLNPLMSFDFESLPLPSISYPGNNFAERTANENVRGRFSFKEDAQNAGVDFQYFNGSRNVASGTTFMYEVMGGGIAVLDINGDLRPDLFFTQGCNWPVDETALEHYDRLYLNQEDGHFSDITSSCGIRENGFSQGVAAGDFDSDGFPDLLIANIGRNRLYHNNGDGTFADVSTDSGLHRSDWTTSCAIADVTGDGHPEIYLVNYLKGDDIFTRTCGPQSDDTCLPQHFDAATDRLLWNRGDETFEDVTHSAGIADGKGLGVVIASIDGSAKPNVFVANDTVMNSYYVNYTASSHDSPRLRNEALISGLAMSAEGRTQACMGVAAGDADGDGELELFITNFHGESNAYYRLTGGAFQDMAMTSGLRQPSLSKLGFGTQFLDADLDGWADVIVANGHIDNFSSDGHTAYQMSAQFFANAGRGKFVEADSSALGAYFQSRVLGRSLARLDWNGDGLEEAVVMHLDAPIALLKNTTKNTGGFLSVRLRGVESSRDAVGATVQIQLSDHAVTRQLTAGDGFQASNERNLIFGLGAEESVSRMVVRWPSGMRSEFGPLKANTHWIAVEGAAQLYSAMVEQAL